MQLFLLMGYLGCNGIDEPEAELIYLALYEPLHDIRDETILQTEAEYELEQTGGTSWDGVIKVTGTLSEDSLSKSFFIDIEMSDVYVQTQNVTFNGEFKSEITNIIEQTDGTSYELTTQLLGELTVTGDAKGIAELNYSFTESYDKDTEIKTPSASGTIADVDITDF